VSVSVSERLLVEDLVGGLWRHGECRGLSVCHGRSAGNRENVGDSRYGASRGGKLGCLGTSHDTVAASFSASAFHTTSSMRGSLPLSVVCKYGGAQTQYGGPGMVALQRCVSSSSVVLWSEGDSMVHPRMNTIEELHSEEEQQLISVPVYDLNRMEIGTMVLPEDVFGVPVRIDILHRVVRWQLARRQQGTHKTKTRSEVSGGGRKPWQQKGSGRARQGTIRAPQWRGGGIVHGPVVRSHAHKLQKRVRRLGLQCAVSAKVSEGRLLVVDSLTPEDGKTGTVKGHVDALLDGAPRQSVLFVDDDISDELKLGSRNLPWVDTVPVHGLNVYSILQRDYLVMSRNAIDAFIERIRKPIRPCSFTP